MRTQRTTIPAAGRQYRLGFRRRSPTAIAAAAGVLLAGSVGAISAPTAEKLDVDEPIDVTVDYAADAGPSTQVASGFLHGIDAEDPPQYLVDGVEVRTIRGADYHHNLPSLYDPATYERVSATGANLQVGVYYY
ncbi:hypothetical protein G1H11_17470 [Phytoactinopolyspora alkaliphila]|uniref:Uncharacterized protein n=1 Tax=Phytoactinopolyspora alkaliphila TaxID=1783498 RepID=A0A6N9YQ49_9ACTN|nr:hypothetical protein [Phytoactinopolyspora alkaliphila]NED97094.1 hypothetical protein [Phytoactinopolyspora alkaliphila]